MITFQIITLFPEYFTSPLEQGLFKQALQKKLIQVKCINPRDYASNKTKRIDDKPYGGGGGMILSYEPLQKALQSLSSQGHVLCLSPKGTLWTAQKAKSLIKEHSVFTLVCGRYEGIDERFVQDFSDESISIGDYVINGGEAAALVVTESLSRFIPQFLGNKNSVEEESFEKDFLLEGPQWTCPQVIGNHKIPSVLLSGHHQNIKEFKLKVSLVLTSLKRPDLFLKSPYSEEDFKTAQESLQKLSDKELQSLGILRKDVS